MKPKERRGVIPIRRDILAPDEIRGVVDLAYDLWQASGFLRGSPEDALFTALQQLRRRTTAGLFLVPGGKSSLHPFVAKRLYLN